MLTSSSWSAMLLALTLVMTPAGAAASSTYTVQQGDSLSSISAQLLGSADRWREIWALNPQIRSPEQLQPGARLRLPTATENALQTEHHATTLLDQSQNSGSLDPIVVMAEDLLRSGHIDRMRTDYRLLATGAPELLIRIHSTRAEADGDYVYIHGLDRVFPEGTLFGLFRPSMEPISETTVELIRTGKARLLLQQDDKARLRVTESSQEDLHTMLALPLERPPTGFNIGYPDAPINAHVIKALYEQSGGYLLILDQGLGTGLKPGHLLRYSKPDLVASQAAPVIKARQGGGWMLVIDTSHEMSLALVLQARQIPAVGDRAH